MHSYGKYILKRVFLSILIVFIVSILAFLIMRLIPGDPVRAMIGVEADAEYVEQLRSELNLDKPLYIQYWLWLKEVLSGDLGYSLLLKEDIASVIKIRLPITLSLGIPATILGTVLGILLGIICATKRGSFIDQVLTFLTTTFAGMPTFWIGIILMYVFGVKLKWLPLFGYRSPADGVGEYIRYATLPVIVLSISVTTSIARHTRTNMLDIINQDYIRTARAYGLPERSVLYRHALKNAMIPVITLIAMQVRMIVGGAVLVETVYSIAGIGRMLTTALNSQDYLVIQACVLIIAIITVTVNLLTDLAYGLLDPRIRKNQER